jgi:hypothetical protein
MKTIDLKFAELCDEIDYWKSEAYKWKNRYIELRQEHTSTVKDSIKHGEAMIGNFVLSNDIAPREQKG